MMGTYSGGYKDEQAGFSSLEELLFNGEANYMGEEGNTRATP